MRHLILVFITTFLLVFSAAAQQYIECDSWDVFIFSDSTLFAVSVDSTDYDSVKLVHADGEIYPTKSLYDYTEDEAGNREIYFTFFYFDIDLYALKSPQLVIF